MLHRRLLSPMFALTLLAALTVGQLAMENEAEAGFFEIFAQGQGGYSGGLQSGGNVLGESGMGQFGFAGGVEILFIGAFIDVRIQDFGVEHGTWNQIGLYSRFNLPEFWIVEPHIDIRSAYLYAQFTEEAEQEYLDSGNAQASPPNKGINTSVLIGLDFVFLEVMYVGFSGELGYHILLPDAEMGFNYHILGNLGVKFGF